MNWRHISSAPKDGTPIEGLYESGSCLVRWAEHRQCMLAGIGGGNGYFGPGWEDEENHLIADEPMAWREETDNTMKKDPSTQSDAETAIHAALDLMRDRRKTDLKEGRSLPCGSAASQRHYGRYEATGEAMGMIAGLIPIVDVLVRSCAQADQQIERQFHLLKKRPVLTSEEEVEESKLDHLP